MAILQKTLQTSRANPVGAKREALANRVGTTRHIMPRRNKKPPRGGFFAIGPKARLLIKRLNLTLQLNQQRTTKAILGGRGRNLHPTFANIVFLNVRTLFALKADTDVVLEALFNEVRAAWVDGQVVGEFWFVV